MPNHKFPIDKNILYHLYIIEKKSASQIAKIVGCSAATVCSRMTEYNIIKRSTTETQSLVIHTKEWSLNISKANTGKSLSKETKEKISATRKLRKIVSFNKGKFKHTHPEIIKQGCKKEKHWNWKGGISSHNILIRQSSQYKNWRNSVFRRDNYTCVKCNQRGNQLQADHIKSFANYPELRFDTDNGRTLCIDCHTKVTKEQRKNNFQ